MRKNLREIEIIREEHVSMLTRISADFGTSSFSRADRRPMRRFLTRVPEELNPLEVSGSCQSQFASTGQGNLAPLSQAGCVGQSLADALFFKIRKVGQQIGDTTADRDGFHNHPNGYAHATNARFPPMIVGSTVMRRSFCTSSS